MLDSLRLLQHSATNLVINGRYVYDVSGVPVVDDDDFFQYYRVYFLFIIYNGRLYEVNLIPTRHGMRTNIKMKL